MTHEPLLDERIRAALQARAEQVTETDLRPSFPPSGDPVRSRVRWAAPLLAAAAVAAIAVVTVVATRPDAAPHGPTVGSKTTNHTPSPTPISTAVSTPVSTSVSSAPSVAELACYFVDTGCGTVSYYVPLWPFATYQAVLAWQASGGSQPWHLDPRLTAQSFVRGFLGFTDLGTVTSSSITADQAHIGIGYRDPNGGLRTAAVVHLVRYERRNGDMTAPWEVVGTDDTSFSIEGPAYGTHVLSPLRVSGHITGTDENIHLWVRSLDGMLADVCCLPAGGDNRPWSRQILFGTKPEQPLTVVASTGGHLQEHERFSVQGVWATQ